jgi:transcriptional regulator with XRE-family HTH domain
MPIDRPGHLIVGDAVATIRKAIGWPQRELGARVGLSQSAVSRIEHGRQDDLTIDSADRLLAAMGARLVVTVDAPFLGDRQRQREPAHALCTAYVARRLRRDGWEVDTEVEIGGDRSRGFIDVLAYHPPTGWLLVIEVKTEIHDLGAIERSLNWYEREAAKAARRRGWQPRRSVGCLLLLATEANDDRVVANRAPFAAGFPARSRDLTAVVAGEATEITRGRAVAMFDPQSRRQAWLRPLRLDGRRQAAPYADYAAFMRAARARPR